METGHTDELVTTVMRHVVKKSLGKAVRACRKSGVAPTSFPGIVALMSHLLEMGEYQKVLAAFDEAGSAFGGYTVEQLLSALAKTQMQNAFLMYCYRFGSTATFQEDIDEAIQWHKNKDLPPPKPRGLMAEPRRSQNRPAVEAI